MAWRSFCSGWRVPVGSSAMSSGRQWRVPHLRGSAASLRPVVAVASPQSRGERKVGTVPVNTVEPFSASLDWGSAFVDSLIWIVRAWAIAALCTVSVLALIARFTTWGQQFWNVTGAYFTGPHSVKVWAWLDIPGP